MLLQCFKDLLFNQIFYFFCFIFKKTRDLSLIVQYFIPTMVHYVYFLIFLIVKFILIFILKYKAHNERKHIMN